MMLLLILIHVLTAAVGFAGSTPTTNTSPSLSPMVTVTPLSQSNPSHIGACGFNGGTTANHFVYDSASVALVDNATNILIIPDMVYPFGTLTLRSPDDGHDNAAGVVFGVNSSLPHHPVLLFLANGSSVWANTTHAATLTTVEFGCVVNATHGVVLSNQSVVAIEFWSGAITAQSAPFFASTVAAFVCLSGGGIGVVLVVTQNIVSVLDAATLSQIWQASLPVDLDEFVGAEITTDGDEGWVLAITATGIVDPFDTRYGVVTVFNATGDIVWGVTYILSRYTLPCEGYAQSYPKAVIAQNTGLLILVDGGDPRFVEARSIKTGELRWRVEFCPSAAGDGGATAVRYIPRRIADANMRRPIILVGCQAQGVAIHSEDYPSGVNVTLPALASVAQAMFDSDYERAAYVSYFDDYYAGCDYEPMCYIDISTFAVQWSVEPTPPPPPPTPPVTPYPPGVCNVSANCGSSYCACGQCNPCKIPGSHPPQIGSCCGTTQAVLCECLNP